MEGGPGLAAPHKASRPPSSTARLGRSRSMLALGPPIPPPDPPASPRPTALHRYLLTRLELLGAPPGLDQPSSKKALFKPQPSPAASGTSVAVSPASPSSASPHPPPASLLDPSADRLAQVVRGDPGGGNRLARLGSRRLFGGGGSSVQVQAKGWGQASSPPPGGDGRRSPRRAGTGVAPPAARIAAGPLGRPPGAGRARRPR